MIVLYTRTPFINDNLIQTRHCHILIIYIQYVHVVPIHMISKYHKKYQGDLECQDPSSQEIIVGWSVVGAPKARPLTPCIMTPYSATRIILATGEISNMCISVSKGDHLVMCSLWGWVRTTRGTPDTEARIHNEQNHTTSFFSPQTDLVIRGFSVYIFNFDTFYDLLSLLTLNNKIPSIC